MTGASSAAALVVRAVPGAGWGDGGELATAACTLGVAHPTGFGAWVLATHLACRAPIGPAAMRVTVAGAVFASLAVAVLAGWLARLASREHGGWGLAVGLLPLALLGAPTWAAYAAQTEVYPAASLWAAATLVLWGAELLGEQGRAVDARRRLALGFLAGLAPAVHAQCALLALLVWAVLGVRDIVRRDRRALRVDAASVAAGVAAVPAWLVPWLCALRHPLLDWNHPWTLARWWSHQTGASIRAAFAGAMGAASPWRAVLYAGAWARQLVEEGAPLLGLAMLALFTGLSRWRAWVLASGAVLVLDGAYSAVVNPMGLPDRQTLSIVLVVLPWMAGVGLALLGRGKSRAVGTAALAAALACVLAGALGPRPLDWSAERFDGIVFDAASSEIVAGGTVALTSDDLSAGWTVRAFVEGRRPDVLPVWNGRIHDPDEWREARRVWGALRVPDEVLGALTPGPAGWLPAGAQVAALRAVERAAGGMGWEPCDAALDALWRGQARLAVPLWWTRGARRRPPVDALLRTTSQLVERAARRGFPADSPRAHYTIAEWLRQAALALVRREAQGAALELLARAVAVAPDHALAWSNFGAVLLRAGHVEQARDAIERAVAQRPAALTDRLNLARAAALGGDRRAARDALRWARRLAGGPGERARVARVAAQLGL